jgi:hypothetical protein
VEGGSCLGAGCPTVGGMELAVEDQLDLAASGAHGNLSSLTSDLYHTLPPFLSSVLVCHVCY